MTELRAEFSCEEVSNGLSQGEWGKLKSRAGHYASGLLLVHKTHRRRQLHYVNFCSSLMFLRPQCPVAD